MFLAFCVGVCCLIVFVPCVCVFFWGGVDCLLFVLCLFVVFVVCVVDVCF